MKKTLTFIGRDRWRYPVYEDEEGHLWKDIDCREGYEDIHSTLANPLFPFLNYISQKREYPIVQNLPDSEMNAPQNMFACGENGNTF